MNKAETRAAIFETLAAIAPEEHPATIPGGDYLREALDLDKMDFMNFVMPLHERTRIDIPEADYPKLRSLDGAVAYFCH